MSSVVHILCSDTARIGKTLLARVFADLASLRREDNPVIFDTDVSGNGIINYFPQKTRLIDLSRISDQVALFDTMMEAGDMAKDGPGGAHAPDFVVDVAASELGRFFDLFTDIGFERGAREAHLDVRIYYLVNWALKSLQRTDHIRSLVSSSRFFVVRNMGVQAFAFTPQPHEVDQVPQIEVGLFLNALSPEVLDLITETGFSFARFLSGEYKNLRHGPRTEIWRFLEEIHNRTSCVVSG